MRIGSLVSPLQDYNTIINNDGITVEGIIPSLQDICVVTDIYDNEGEMIIKIAESRFFYYGTECGFLQKIWVEIQEDVSLETLLQEIDEHICVPLL